MGLFLNAESAVPIVIGIREGTQSFFLANTELKNFSAVLCEYFAFSAVKFFNLEFLTKRH